jgi:hypothetical protein
MIPLYLYGILFVGVQTDIRIKLLLLRLFEFEHQQQEIKGCIPLYDPSNSMSYYLVPDSYDNGDHLNHNNYFNEDTLLYDCQEVIYQNTY